MAYRNVNYICFKSSCESTEVASSSFHLPERMYNVVGESEQCACATQAPNTVNPSVPKSVNVMTMLTLKVQVD